MIVKKIVGSIFSIGIVAASAILGFSSVLKQNYKGNKYATWMSSLNDNTSLRAVNMPGSHDTMALYSIGDLAGQCQSLSLADQLNLGVRFLDIRLKQEGNNLKAVHGFIDQRATFDDVNNVVNEFLTAHPSEFIIMSIKEEADASNPIGSFEDCLKAKINGKYLLNTTLPASLTDTGWMRQPSMRWEAGVLHLQNRKTDTILFPCGWRT